MVKVCVTGGAGFIGSHLVDVLLDKGMDVFVVDNLSTGKRENLNPKARLFQLDIQNPDIKILFKEEKPRVVFHLAAQIDVRKATIAPDFDANVNIIGTLNILLASLSCGINKFIFSSTGGAIYGESPEEGSKEDDLLKPLSPYGVSKMSGEKYIELFGKTRGLNYTILRFGNVYGPRQDPYGEAGVVAIFSEAMWRKNNVVIYGYGKMKRDYVYVKDVVEACVLSIENGNGEVYNIGTGKGTSGEELYRLMSRISEYEKEAKYEEIRFGELWSSCLSCEKAKIGLKWEAKSNLEDGLKKTMEWFRDKISYEK